MVPDSDSELDAAELGSAVAQVLAPDSDLEPDVVLVVQDVVGSDLEPEPGEVLEEQALVLAEPDAEDLDSALGAVAQDADHVLRIDQFLDCTSCLEGKTSEELDAAVLDVEDEVHRSIHNVESSGRTPFLEGNGPEQDESSGKSKWGDRRLHSKITHLTPATGKL